MLLYRKKQGNQTFKKEYSTICRASCLFFSGVRDVEGGDEGIPAASALFFGVKGGPEVILI